MYKDLKIKWLLSVLDADSNFIESREINPLFTESTSINGEIPDGNVFMRFSINGEITLSGDDFDFITQYDIENEFTLNATWNTTKGNKEFEGSFFFTDCTIDYDKKLIRVTVNTVDQYENILKKLNNEYDVVSYAPAVTPISFHLRGIQQYYLVQRVGGDKVTNILSGVYWEEDVTEPTTDPDVLESYGFNLCFEISTVSLQVWGRVIHGDLPLGEPRRKDDFTALNRLYTKVSPLHPVDTMTFRDFSTVTPNPTEWGLAYQNYYYLKPNEISGFYWVPIARSQWAAQSKWLSVPASWANVVDDLYGVVTELRNTYKLSEVIRLLLAQIDPNITHDNLPEYSTILYSGDNPLGMTFDSFLTPKSNLINANYDEPARKGLLSLETVLNYLRDVFRIYWYIDSENRFCLEHISFFMNGYSYEDSPDVGVDLTVMYEPRNRKKWSSGINSITYDVSDLPQRYEVKYTNECTIPFAGNPIDIKNKYIKGNTEEVNINTIEGDVDYIVSTSTTAQVDGWVLMCTPVDELILGYYIFVAPGNIQYKIQNHYTSLWYALPTYYPYDLPSDNVEMNGEQIDVKGVKKVKFQDVIIPQSAFIDEKKLVRTEIGEGQISELSLNLSNEIATVTLCFPIKNIEI